jgi:DNA invertase Pin-like site-specific DNA recombinase
MDVLRRVLAIANSKTSKPMPKRERIKPGMAAAKSKGKTFGRTTGYIPTRTCALEAEVLELVEQGQSYRAIASKLKLSKNTVMGIVKRSKAEVLPITPSIEKLNSF